MTWNSDSDFDDFLDDGLDDETEATSDRVVEDPKDEELGIDYTARRGGALPLEGPPKRGVPTLKSPKKYKIKRMSPAMARRCHNVMTILVTKTDGSQVLLVRG
jgi:hypothetical protein